MNILKIGLMSAALVAGLASANAQVVAADSVMQHANGKRLSIGSYGEVAFSRNFYSDSGNRYSSASLHKDDPNHGRFDIPHAVIYLGTTLAKAGHSAPRSSLSTEAQVLPSNMRQRSLSSLNRNRRKAVR